MVLADFSKAFDTVCFKTTLKKFYKLDPRADDLQFVCIRPARQPRSIHILFSIH